MTEQKVSEATAARDQKPQPYRGFIARFPRAILEVTKISMYGTKKHNVPLNDMSFKTIPGAEYNMVEAECRHLLKEAIEGPVDQDTGFEDLRDTILHKAEKAWNAMADLEVALYQIEEARFAKLSQEVMEDAETGRKPGLGEL